MSYKDFFEYACKRERVRLAREYGQPRPWTEDTILQNYRFCNIFREDDKTTRWIREHINHGTMGERLLQAIVIARWFNRIETLERLLQPIPDIRGTLSLNMFNRWDSNVARKRLLGVSPLVTGAYIVKTPAKMSKLEGVIWCLEHLLGAANMMQYTFKEAEVTLENATEHLCTYPYLGPFMAYEIVTDLRHTPILESASDIMTWANPGPGAVRGYGRVVTGDRNYYNRHSKHDKKIVILGMRGLLAMSKSPGYWPSYWRAWEMREVEHTLCEFDKYERARLGEGRPKQRFRGGSP